MQRVHTRGEPGILINAGEFRDLIKTGRVFELGLGLHKDIPMMDPDWFMPYRYITCRTPEDLSRLLPGGVTFHIDAIQGCLHLSTHIDALIHCQFRGQVHGGRSARRLRTDFGWKSEGAETIPPLLLPGLFLDIASQRGVEVIPDGEEIALPDIEAALVRHRLFVQPGSAVLIRTGKIRQFCVANSLFIRGCPGLAPDAAAWLAEQGVKLVGIDAPSISPIGSKVLANAHVTLLVDHGVYVLENATFESLRENDVWQFLFICLPLKIHGATGSWVRPVAVC